MHQIKAKICEKFQIESRVQRIKKLPKNPKFQLGIAALILVILLSW